MKGIVKEGFVDELRGLYLPEGVEIEVPEDRAAAFERFVRFEKQAETAKKAAKKPTKKAAKK